MRVSELADRAGITPQAIRFYESEGILPTAARAANGYRRYTDADVCRLRIVVSLRNLGIDLAESGRLADLCASERCTDMTGELAARLVQRRNEVAAARAELDHLDAELAGLQRALATGVPADPLCGEGKESCS